MPCDQQTGISKKIESSDERQRLREVIKNFSFAKTGGFIVRTASLKRGKRELVRDAKFLYHIWLKIYKKAEQQKAPALIYEEGELTWKIVRDYLTEKVDKLIIDSEEEYQKIRKFVQTLIGREMVNKIQCYKGNTPLFDSKRVSKDLQSIYDTHVYVKSGAYIVINPTEGLTVVDVNSGKFKTKASPGDAAFMVNMEVVPEIARQLRLRDLGGIIVIDFIDMTKEDHKRKVLDALQKALARDHAKTEVGNRISPLGLVEMTRARTGKTIESISFGKCPFCDGRGRVKIA
jgi:Rne/Rng family ribonuclease